MKRFLLSFFLFFTLLMIPFVCQADSDLNWLYVWDGSIPYEDTSTIPVYAVRWRKLNGKYYFFLPSGIDPSNLRIHLTGGASQVYINDVLVKNNEVTDQLQPGTDIIVKRKKTEYKVVVLQSSSTVSVFIRTSSGNVENLMQTKRNTERGSWCIMDENGAIVEFSDFDYIRARGNSSFRWPKLPLHIHLNEKTDILGMGKSKTWILVPSYRDNSMIRNAVTLDLAAAADMAYTSQYRFAEVYLNRIYYGTYIITEKVQVGSNRVNITDLQKLTEALNTKALNRYARNEELAYAKGAVKYYNIPNDPVDITGGYLLMVEANYRFKEEPSGFVTADGQSVIVKEPEYISKAQLTYISGLVQSFENAIDAEDGIDPATGKHFFEIADKDSLVKKYIIEEVTKNLDANKTSYYIYKYNDYVSDKLFWGPVWDYDNAYGMFRNDEGYDLTDPEGLWAAADENRDYYFYPKLYQHQEFVDAVCETYASVIRPLLCDLLGIGTEGRDAALMSLAEYEEMLTDAAAMNFLRWPTFNDPEFPYPTGEDFPANIAFIRTFLTARMQYLDSIWLK